MGLKVPFLKPGEPFPNPLNARRDGLLAVGNILSPEMVLEAYQQGIFPWFNEGEPVMWWSPDPRCVIYPEQLKVSKSMQKVMKDGVFSVSFDTCFLDVINHCRFIPRNGQFGTWITDEIVGTYHELHKMGYAHSVEVWQGDTLVGGLYGISLGSIFMGESMFSKESNASKFALISLAQQLMPLGFTMIDCQLHNAHLESLGAVEIPRPQFLEELSTGLDSPTWMGTWEF